ncbi:MAG: argininosuccinate lyase, partial [Gemmatimonadota bacterium]|nr:argininosuccinate lyase [Gemmatimonadota bacterium]
EAHSAVGSLVRQAEAEACELHDLTIDSFAAAHSLFGEDVYRWLDPVSSVGRRNIPGGTGPDAVRAQLETARAAIRPVRDTPRGNELSLQAV